MNIWTKIFYILCVFILFLSSAYADSSDTNAYQYTKQLFHDAGDPVQGNPQGSITLVEFIDYECPYCMQMVAVVDKLSKKNPQLRVIYKELSIHGEVSDFAAAAVLAANKQGKFVAMHNTLARASRPLSDQSILDAAQSVGLSMEKLKADMNDPAIAKKLRATYELANELEVSGTPTFFLGKTQAKPVKGSVLLFVGGLDEKQFQTVLNQLN
jgi:protein-disulfide isomerase